jgi:hypothetical protein
MAQLNNQVIFPRLINEDGQVVPIDHEQITQIVFKALKAAENPDRLMALNIADKIIQRLIICKGFDTAITLEQVYDMTEFVLFELGNYRAAKELNLERSNQTVQENFAVNIG